MSDKPEQPQGAAGRDELQKAPVDLLNEIMDRSMPPISDPPEETSDEANDNGAPPKPSSGFVGKGGAREWDEECPPGRSESERTLPRRVSRETSEENEAPRSPSEKSRSPSSAYVYLMVLFGAAFLMILLAYFVQRRNNDAMRDDLRTTTASREELLENIKTLEEEKLELQQTNERLNYESGLLKEEYEKEQESMAENQQLLDELQTQRDIIVALSYLERFVSEKDYLMAACVVQDCDPLFNEHNPMHPTNSTVLPIQAARYLELRNWLEDHDHVDVYQYFSNEDGSGNTEQPAVALRYTQQTRDLVTAAQNLWSVFRHYTEFPFGDLSARFLADFYQPGIGGDSDYLNTRNFQPSTIELLEQIKADLIDRGMLIEADGVITYAQDWSSH